MASNKCSKSGAAAAHEFTTHHDHQKYALSGLDKQRRANQFCDVTVIVDGKRFPLHRSVLSMMCKHFELMFKSDFQEATAPEVTIEGSSDAFGRLMDFAYTGKLQVQPDMIVDITQMACYLQFSDALESCADVFKKLCRHKTVNAEMVFQMSLVSEKYSSELKPLVALSVEYLTANFPQFCQMEVFLKDVTADFLEKFLDRDDLTALAEDMTEMKILKAVTDWLEHDWGNRKEYAEKLLKKIRLGVIPKPQLKDCISKTLMVEPGCKKLIEDVLKSEEDATWCNDGMFTSRGIKVLMKMDWTLGNNYLFEYYHPEECTWVKDFPELRLQASTSHEKSAFPISLNSIDGHLYVGIRRSLAFRYFMKLDMDTRQWKQLPAMERPFTGCSIVHLNNHLYVIGGHSTTGENLKGACYGREVRRFDVVTEKWEDVAPIPLVDAKKAISNIEPEAIVYKGNLVVHVGEGCSRSSLFVYNPSRNAWHSCGIHVSSPYGVRFAVDDGELFRVCIYNYDMEEDNGGMYEGLIPDAAAFKFKCTGFDNWEDVSVKFADDDRHAHHDSFGSGGGFGSAMLFAVNDHIYFDLHGCFYKTGFHVNDYTKAEDHIFKLVGLSRITSGNPFALFNREFNCDDDNFIYCTHIFKKAKVMPLGNSDSDSKHMPLMDSDSDSESDSDMSHLSPPFKPRRLFQVKF